MRGQSSLRFSLAVSSLFREATAGEWLRTDYLVELLPFGPMQSDLRPNCAVAQFAKPPTRLKDAEWGTLHGDL
jgi:hypothetical protein